MDFLSVTEIVECVKNALYQKVQEQRTEVGLCKFDTYKQVHYQGPCPSFWAPCILDLACLSFFIQNYLSLFSFVEEVSVIYNL